MEKNKSGDFLEIRSLLKNQEFFASLLYMHMKNMITLEKYLKLFLKILNKKLIDF